MPPLDGDRLGRLRRHGGVPAPLSRAPRLRGRDRGRDRCGRDGRRRQLEQALTTRATTPSALASLKRQRVVTPCTSCHSSLLLARTRSTGAPTRCLASPRAGGRAGNAFPPRRTAGTWNDDPGRGCPCPGPRGDLVRRSGGVTLHGRDRLWTGEHQAHRSPPSPARGRPVPEGVLAPAHRLESFELDADRFRESGLYAVPGVRRQDAKFWWSR